LCADRVISESSCHSHCTLRSSHPRVFFLLPCLSPASTLFPYTTLFRSRCCRLRTSSASHPRNSPMTTRRTSATPSAPSARPSTGDRKSTRLNSSHVSISYAVFCLKKKTYIIIINQEYLRQNIQTTKVVR